MSLSTPFLSIIIPAYNEEKRLPGTLARVFEFVSGQPYSAEVLVIENGSEDATWEIAQNFSEEHPNFRSIKLEEKGKGLAVKKGMLEARGEYRFMCDADLSMPINEISRFLPPVLTDFDVAIGSRESAGAVRYDEPSHRHWGGRMVNLLIRLLILPGYQDTQCGFKCFSAAAADKLFTRQTLAGWSFDIEILFIAKSMGFKIVEIPIPWYFNPESKLRPVKDALKIALDILKIRQNALQGLYS